MTNAAEDNAAKADPQSAHGTASTAVLDYLRGRNITFFHTTHPVAYTTQQAAAVAHVPGNEFGKAVLVELTNDADVKEKVMCVLRAPDRVKLATFAKAVNARHADLCDDDDVRALGKTVVEAGALPPLPLFNKRIFMDSELAKGQLIHFCAGSHHEIVTMEMNTFVQLVKPHTLAFAEPIDIHMRELTKLLSKFDLGLPHGIIRHRPSFTASETAKEVSVPGLAMVKSVVVKLDGRVALCAVPSTDIIDFDKLAMLANVKLAELATEEEIKEHFPGVEVGAIPPFGCLFKVPLYLDEGVGCWPIKGDGDVVFHAGTHTDSMIMRFMDYLRVNRKWNEPVIGKFSKLDTGAGHPWTSSHIKRYLADKDVPFTSLRHSRAFTASEIAHAAHISGNSLAKLVMVKVEGDLAMAVLRAADFVDLDKLYALTGNKQVCLAEEAEFADLFAHVEPGAAPPFGQLYPPMKTFVDSKLAAVDSLYVSAGTHKELLSLKWSDYNRIVCPIVGDFSRQ